MLVDLHAGYTFRYYSVSHVASPGDRLEGWSFEGAVGYPNFTVGPVLVRPEALVRWETLSIDVPPSGPAGGGMSGAIANPTVLSLGLRLTLTYASRFGAVDVGAGMAGSQLRALKEQPTTHLHLYDDMGRPQSYYTDGWAPAIELTVRWGTPELRMRWLSFQFAAFLELGYTLDWRLSALDAATSPPTRDINSFSVRWGFLLRVRAGDIKPYE
jgi:hypothetical protein